MKIVCLRSLYSVGLKKRKRKEKNTLIIIESIEFYHLVIDCQSKDTKP